MSLQKNAMIVQLSISQPNGKRKDKRIDDSAAKACNTEVSFLDSSKYIIDKAMFKVINKAANRLRTRHYQLTVPWRHNGEALLPASLYFQYTQEMRALKDDFERTVSSFINNYELYKSNARARLGELYDESDYPPAESFNRSFGVKISFAPVPSESHFVVDLESEEIEEIKTSVREEISAAEKQVVNHLWTKLYDQISHIYETLSDPEAIFRDSLVDNILQLTEMVPVLNVLNDEHVANVVTVARKFLCGHSADELRHNLEVRQQVADHALTLRQTMEKREKEHGHLKRNQE